MSNSNWATGSTPTLGRKIDSTTFQAAASLAVTPSFHTSMWCEQGHIMRTTDAACPVCRIAVAELLSDVLERLSLGLIDSLEGGEPLIGRHHSDFDMLRFESVR